jgi:hypothetical protein
MNLNSLECCKTRFSSVANLDNDAALRGFLALTGTFAQAKARARRLLKDSDAIWERLQAGFCQIGDTYFKRGAPEAVCTASFVERGSIVEFP